MLLTNIEIYLETYWLHVSSYKNLAKNHLEEIKHHQEYLVELQIKITEIDESSLTEKYEKIKKGYELEGFYVPILRFNEIFKLQMQVFNSQILNEKGQ